MQLLLSVFLACYFVTTNLPVFVLADDIVILKAQFKHQLSGFAKEQFQ